MIGKILDLLKVVLRCLLTADSMTEHLKWVLVVIVTCILLVYSPEVTIYVVVSDTVLTI